MQIKLCWTLPLSWIISLCKISSWMSNSSWFGGGIKSSGNSSTVNDKINIPLIQTPGQSFQSGERHISSRTYFTRADFLRFRMDSFETTSFCWLNYTVCGMWMVKVVSICHWFLFANYTEPDRNGILMMEALTHRMILIQFSCFFPTFFSPDLLE